MAMILLLGTIHIITFGMLALAIKLGPRPTPNPPRLRPRRRGKAPHHHQYPTTIYKGIPPMINSCSEGNRVERTLATILNEVGIPITKINRCGYPGPDLAITQGRCGTHAKN